MKKHLVVLIIFLSFLQLSAQEVPKEFIVYFNIDSYELSQSAKATLDSIAPYTKQFRDVSISGAGYTDDSGVAGYNKVLAANRLNAAKRYLEAQGLAIIAIDSNYNTTAKPSTPEKQRRVEINIKGKNFISTGAGYSEQEFNGRGGTVVIANVKNGSDGAISINEYFSPESMIANEMYAIDVDGNILQTDGMIEICRDVKKLDPNGKTFTVKMPANRGKINRQMSIWLQVKKDDGEIAWQNTTIEITTDPEEKFYIFKIPAGTQGCLKINLDRPCATPNNKKGRPVAVYIETYKAFDFYTVCVTSDSYYPTQSYGPTFSAKLNARLWVFTADEDDNIRNMNFFGKYRDNDNITQTFGGSLSTAKYRYNKKDHSHHFFILENPKTTPLKGKTVLGKETGFWAWLRRVFGGSK